MFLFLEWYLLRVKQDLGHAQTGVLWGFIPTLSSSSLVILTCYIPVISSLLYKIKPLLLGVKLFKAMLQISFSLSDYKPLPNLHQLYSFL